MLAAVSKQSLIFIEMLWNEYEINNVFCNYDIVACVSYLYLFYNVYV